VRIYVTARTLTDDEQVCPSCLKLKKNLCRRGPNDDLFAWICDLCYKGRTSLCAIAANHTNETALDMLEECPDTSVNSDVRLQFLTRGRKETEEVLEALKVHTYPAVDTD
jgi:hypothetical protein